jgi:hypothetical protein
MPPLFYLLPIFFFQSLPPPLLLLPPTFSSSTSSSIHFHFFYFHTNPSLLLYLPTFSFSTFTYSLLFFYPPLVSSPISRPVYRTLKLIATVSAYCHQTRCRAAQSSGQEHRFPLCPAMITIEIFKHTKMIPRIVVTNLKDRTRTGSDWTSHYRQEFKPPSDYDFSILRHKNNHTI